MAASPDRPPASTRLHRHHRSSRCLLQAGERPRGHDVTALLAKAVAVWSWLRHPQVNAAYSEAGNGLSGPASMWRGVAMDDGGPAQPRSWPTPTNRPLFASRAAGRPGGPLPCTQNSSSQPSTAPAPSPSNWAWYGVDRFDGHPAPGTGAILACAGFAALRCGGQRRSISVKRQNGQVKPQPADTPGSSMAPRRGPSSKDLCRLDRNRPRKAWPSDVSAAPERRRSPPDLPTLTATTSICLSRALPSAGGAPATPPRLLAVEPDGSARHRCKVWICRRGWNPRSAGWLTTPARSQGPL